MQREQKQNHGHNRAYGKEAAGKVVENGNEPSWLGLCCCCLNAEESCEERGKGRSKRRERKRGLAAGARVYASVVRVRARGVWSGVLEHGETQGGDSANSNRCITGRVKVGQVEALCKVPNKMANAVGSVVGEWESKAELAGQDQSGGKLPCLSQSFEGGKKVREWWGGGGGRHQQARCHVVVLLRDIAYSRSYTKGNLATKELKLTDLNSVNVELEGVESETNASGADDTGEGNAGTTVHDRENGGERESVDGEVG